VENQYAPHEDFVRLYDLYTGPQSIAADLAEQMVGATSANPLLVSTGSDLVLFPGGGASPIAESFRHSTRGFKEMTAVSHLGTTVAWLAEMHETGNPEWQHWASRLIDQANRTRELCNRDFVQKQIAVEAWREQEEKIARLLDYGCRTTSEFLQDCLADPSKLSFDNVREDFLEPRPGSQMAVPFNDVMVATFALTFLDIAYRTMNWIHSQSIDWQKIMVLIAGPSGRPTAGLTWATNNMCHLLWRASGKSLPPERLLIAAHLPGLEVDELSNKEMVEKLEAVYRGYWCKTRVTADIGAKMFEGFPAFVPNIDAAPIITSATKTLAEMPRLRDPDDRLTAISRLRLVMEDPRQLLSNSVAEFIIDELCVQDMDPSRVRIPGFTNVDFPAVS
jgi:hypothetical protein